jgi:hypothetical protein
MLGLFSAAVTMTDLNAVQKRPTAAEPGPSVRGWGRLCPITPSAGGSTKE